MEYITVTDARIFKSWNQTKPINPCVFANAGVNSLQFLGRRKRTSAGNETERERERRNTNSKWRWNGILKRLNYEIHLSTIRKKLLALEAWITFRVARDICFERYFVDCDVWIKVKFSFVQNRYFYNVLRLYCSCDDDCIRTTKQNIKRIPWMRYQPTWKKI